MTKLFPLFKKWVPGWLVSVLLFITIMPSMVLFFLPLANINAAAGHYGGEPADIQFAVALFYSGYAGFYALERRFFSYLATKEYFIVFSVLQILLATGCYLTNEVFVLFPLRFIQGMLFACMVNLSLSLMFTRLHSERAREVGYSVFFCLLLVAMPFNNLITADSIDSFNFNLVYKWTIFSYLPGLVMLMISMNNVRLNVRFPLYQLDWQSFVLLSVPLCLFGYVMIYGQEYYWLEDSRISLSIVTGVILLFIFFMRQSSSKRPYIHNGVFASRNFNLSLLLLLILYVCRFASGITNTFFSSSLGFDPMHVSYINVCNIVGVVVGVAVSCFLIVRKKSVRLIWMSGFLLLLAFHFMMLFLFNPEANAGNFFVPLFLQGMGVGMLLVPIIVYTIASVSPAVAPSAAAVCLIARYAGFAGSIGIVNYFELYGRSRHYNAFQDKLTALDYSVHNKLAGGAGKLHANGLLHSQTTPGSDKLLVKAVNVQTQLRFAMDYYEMMCWLLIGTLLFIAFFPYLNRTMVYLKARMLSPI